MHSQVSNCLLHLNSLFPYSVVTTTHIQVFHSDDLPELDLLLVLKLETSLCPARVVCRLPSVTGGQEEQQSPGISPQASVL